MTLLSLIFSCSARWNLTQEMRAKWLKTMYKRDLKMTVMKPQVNSFLPLLPRIMAKMMKAHKVWAKRTFRIVFIILFRLVNWVFKMTMPESATVAPRTKNTTSVVLVLSLRLSSEWSQLSIVLLLEAMFEAIKRNETICTNINKGAGK